MILLSYFLGLGFVPGEHVVFWFPCRGYCCYHEFFADAGCETPRPYCFYGAELCSFGDD